MKPATRIAVLVPLTLVLTIVGSTLSFDLNVTSAGDEEPVFTSLYGDLDGNGNYTVADPIHMLNWLFTNGPDLAIFGTVPATGITDCYDSIASIDCGDEDFPSQDGDIQAGCEYEERFVDNDDGTVTDKCTGLTWQQDTALPGKDYQAEDDGSVTWSNALKYCDELSLGGHSDWRLPNINELMSIIDWSVADLGSPAMNSVFPEPALDDGTAVKYWSSTTRPFLSSLAWLVDFGGGSDDAGDDQPPTGTNTTGSKLFDVYLVRAVRSGN